MKNRILAIVVTYNPNIIELEQNLSEIYSQVDAICLVDNNSKNKEEIQVLQERIGFSAIYNKENIGLGKAYNIIINNELENFKYIVTFDQDTKILECTIDVLIGILENNIDFGVVGPKFSRNESKVDLDGRLVVKDGIIQSCAIFRKEAVEEIGGFNEDFFIDSIDFEYCLRLREKKWKVGIYDGVVIKHELGKIKRKYGFSFYSHNKIRNFYIARNHMVLTRRFFLKFPEFIIKKNIFFILHFLKLIFLERDKHKIKYFLLGLKDRKFTQ